MSISIVANRIYARAAHGIDSTGRIAAEDVQEMAPDTLLLRGCKPPGVKQAEGSSIMAAASMANIKDTVGDENKSHPTRACCAFEVVALPHPDNQSRGNPLKLAPGDVVVCFNAVVDPLLGNDLAVTNMYLGVQFVIERAKRVEA